MISSVTVTRVHHSASIDLTSDSLSLQNGGGSGFGLYIAKAVVELHHGCIWAESEGSGKGSVFSVQLPLSKV
jgi:signal transduction histidine kinase